MDNYKISFLIAAHNEEKIISKALDNLLRLPYSSYEVLVGLDGCTDSTEDIVKKYSRRSSNFKYYKTNSRSGKHDVINELISKATGDIVIIHDADWIFKVSSSKVLKSFLSVFKDPNIGGIAESFPIELDDDNLSKSNIGYRMVCYSTLYWYEFQKRNFAVKKKGYWEVKVPSLFMTNIFRRELYEKNLLLGDDFERTGSIMKKGYSIVFFDDVSTPRMIASYSSIGISSLFKQKIRTALARRQLSGESRSPGLFNYYIPSIVFMLRRSFNKDFKTGLEIIFWVFLTSLATVISRFKSMNTKEGWNLRARK